MSENLLFLKVQVDNEDFIEVCHFEQLTQRTF